jgi:hypothetical protein
MHPLACAKPKREWLIKIEPNQISQTLRLLINFPRLKQTWRFNAAWNQARFGEFDFVQTRDTFLVEAR